MTRPANQKGTDAPSDRPAHGGSGLCLFLLTSIILAPSGCTTTQGPATSSDTAAANYPIIDSAKPPKPKPELCVAFGKTRENQANQQGINSVQRQQLIDQARESYKRALDIDPKHVPAQLALAQLYSNVGNHERAIATYQEILTDHPEEASVWFELGMYYARHKEWPQAAESLSKAIEIDPENLVYNNQLGFCLARAGRYDEALVYLRKAGSEAKAHYNLARMMHHLNQDDLCRQHLLVALQSDPQFGAAQQMLDRLEGRIPDSPQADVNAAQHSEAIPRPAGYMGPLPPARELRNVSYFGSAPGPVGGATPASSLANPGDNFANPPVGGPVTPDAMPSLGSLTPLPPPTGVGTVIPIASVATQSPNSGGQVLINPGQGGQAAYRGLGAATGGLSNQSPPGGSFDAGLPSMEMEPPLPRKLSTKQP